MKSVKSVSHLQTLALGKGASARVGGVTMNSTAERIQTASQPKPEPVAPPEAPAKPVAEPKSPDLLPALITSMDHIGACVKQSNEAQSTNAEALTGLAKILEKLIQQTPAQKAVGQEVAKQVIVNGWVMTVQRDTRGLMTHIVVDAKP